ncbi:MAG: hypothetical protein VYD19_00145, partial [Myxococcota bacterium]|nr:hypothetical protein [Myxococcota bacterium]
MKKLDRRALLQGGAGTLGALLLRGLASGLPPAYLLNPQSARAQEMLRHGQQTLILSTSSRGDPLNINCPGSYVEGVTNHPRLPAGRGRFGGQNARGAQVWAELPNDLRQRLAFFHYSPRTAAHPEYPQTLSLRGSVKNEQGNGTEMFPSAMAQLAYTPGLHLQEEPVPLCSSFLSFRAQPLQTIRPTDLKSLFNPEDPALADLRQTRDQVLDTLYADLLANGRRSQREFIDRYANSREQARALGEQLGEYLEGLPANPDEPNSITDEIIAAVAL